MRYLQKHSLADQLLWAFHHATKREKLIFSTFSMTACVLLTTFSAMPLWLVLFSFTLIAVVCLVLFSLWTDFGGIRFFYIPLLPVLFTIAFLTSLLVIPMHPVLRFGLVGVYGVAMYLIMLISNIFNIAAVKTIPLMRAAHAANFSLTIVIVFLLTFFVSTLGYKLQLNPIVQIALLMFTIFWPAFYLLWSFRLATTLTRDQVSTALIVAIIMAEVGLVVEFWPVSRLLTALYLATIFYVCAGILQHSFVKKLHFKIVAEYVAALLFAFCLLIITAQWSG